jgi:DNA-binding response OmpR family regulator
VRKTILVVDDEPTVRETVAEALALEGYAVALASTGSEGLTKYRETRPDLVVLDLMLPEMSGLEVCRVIRAESNVPILMLTARDAEVDKIVGLEVGADDYVTKPFSLRELSARVRALLRRSEQPLGTEGTDRPIDLGRVRVDLAGHRVLRDGNAVALTPRAFELLAFFLQNQGQTFTRDQLLERVWGYEYGGETRTVDVHVHWLRRIIEDDPAHPILLQTVRGVGYVFRGSR